MTTRARRWPVVVPAALSLLAALELAAYLLFAPVTTAPDGTTAGALAAGNAVLVAFAALVVAGAGVGTAGAARNSPRLVWLPAAALALLGVVGTAVGPQVLAVALLLVLAALLEEATPDPAPYPRRNGAEPSPPPGGGTGEPEPGVDGPATVGSPGRAAESPGRAAESPDRAAESPGTDAPPGAGAGGAGAAVAPADGPDREVVLAALLLVPLAALLGVSAATTPVARVAVAATAAAILGGAGLSVAAAAGYVPGSRSGRSGGNN